MNQDRTLGSLRLRSFAVLTAGAALATMAGSPAEAAFQNAAATVISPYYAASGPESYSFLSGTGCQYGAGYCSEDQDREIVGGQTLNYSYDYDGLGGAGNHGTINISNQLLNVVTLNGASDTIAGKHVAIILGTKDGSGNVNTDLTIGDGHDFSASYDIQDYTSPNGTLADHLVYGDLGITFVASDDTTFGNADDVSFSGTLNFTNGTSNLESAFGSDSDGTMLALLGVTLEKMCTWDGSDCSSNTGLSMIGPTNNSSPGSDDNWYRQIFAENLFYSDGDTYTGSYCGGLTTAPDGCTHHYKKQNVKVRVGAYTANPGGGNHPVPEPASMALFGAGLAGIGFIRRRKAAKA